MFKYDANALQHQQAQEKLNLLLLNYDYFNHQLLDHIQQLTVGHQDYFDVQLWQELLSHQDNIATHFSHFLFFYQENIQDIQNTLQQSTQHDNLKQQHEKSTHNTNENISFDTRYLFIQYWLEAFKPFAAMNLPLVWQVFQQYPCHIFPLLIDLPSHILKAEYIEDFYLLSQQQQLGFTYQNISPIQYLSRFYQQFPELLAQVPNRYHSSTSIHLKKDLLLSLSHYTEHVSYDIQNFILSVYLSEQPQKSELYIPAVECLKKCSDINIPSHVIMHLKTLLDDETLLDNENILCLALTTMHTLHGIGIQEQWFKEYLLSALEHSCCYNGHTPRSTAIQLLLGWQEDGLYAANKIIKILKQAIQQSDVNSFSDFLPYISAHPQYSTYSHTLLWQYLEQLDQKIETDRRMNIEFLSTFIDISARLFWQPDDAQWAILSSAIEAYIRNENDEKRKYLFDLLRDNLKIEQTKIDALLQLAQQQECENLKNDNELKNII